MSATISVDQLSGAIENELTLYSEKIIKGLKTQSKESMKKLVDATRATAPVGHRGIYKASITSKVLSETDRGVSYVWYVQGSADRLSHLLEKGHALRNGGRVSGTHFIANALDPIMEEYEQKIKEIISNGG